MFAVGITDKGQVRSQNQDTVFCSLSPVGALPNLFIVADGMGGHNAGDVASKTAVETFCRRVSESTGQTDFLDIMVDAAGEANQAVHDLSISNDAYSGMGTTFSACMFSENKCEIIHVGDSRIYMILNNEITQLTTDHSYVNEMMRAGKMTPEEAKNHPKRSVLTRVLGTSPEKDFDGYPHTVEAGCALLLCSDGLTNMLNTHEILEIVSRAETVEKRAEELVSEANLRGGNDNISVVLIDTAE